MGYSQRYNGNMKRVGDSLTAAAAAGHLLFLFSFLTSTQRMKLRALGTQTERGIT